ncbi:BON domain-containing protein [Caenimonas terrae]|uniref:BON domain-containing protein n=1 Tax=Caenimonas terrae TaxID=696074 RepID=A0ABW0NEV9_9BURK
MRARWLLVLAALPVLAGAQERKNYFEDPFLPVTSAIAGCPVPAPPGMTEEELKKAAHVRAQHGTSCYLAGRCRLPNSYLYDKELVPRVAQYLQRDGRFDDTSLWILGERRLITVMGCVQSREQAQALERAIGLVDDVMGVIDYTMVGTKEPPRYQLAQ